MSKCRPDCCSGSSGGGSELVVIGFVVLAAAVYGIIRAIVHAVEAIVRTVIEIVEITAITAGSVAAVILLAIIAVRIARWRRSQIYRAQVKIIDAHPANSLIVGMRGPGKSALDPAELFAEAVASPDMDPRFVEKILRNAMDGPDR